MVVTYIFFELFGRWLRLEGISEMRLPDRNVRPIGFFKFSRGRKDRDTIVPYFLDALMAW